VADRAAAAAFFNGKLNLQEQGRLIEFLPANSPVRLSFQVGDSPPRSGNDPDGVPIDMVPVN
jgi:hypothetical protein